MTHPRPLGPRRAPRSIWKLLGGPAAVLPDLGKKGHGVEFRSPCLVLYELAGLASLARPRSDWLDVKNGGVLHINSSGSQPNGVNPENRSSPMVHR